MEKEKKITWREVLSHALIENSDTWGGIESLSITDGQLSAEFDHWAEHPEFVAWTKNYVYFSGGDDGGVWVEWIARHPSSGDSHGATKSFSGWR